MSAHTPGPWRVGACGSVVADHPIPELSGSDEVEYYGGHLVAESIAPQNMALIAAAPELLAEAHAAVAFLKTVEWNDSTSETDAGNLRIALEAAIAKAEDR